MRLRGWLTVGLVALLPPSCISACTIHDDGLNDRFQRVTDGMRQEAVIELLGRPRSVVDCKEPGSFQPQDRPDCARIYLYPSLLQPPWPFMWAVWFDANGVAIGKFLFCFW